jgi:hypothetical protein
MYEKIELKMMNRLMRIIVEKKIDDYMKEKKNVVIKYKEMKNKNR